MNTYEVITLMIMSCMLLISLVSLIIAIVKAILGQKIITLRPQGN